MYYYPRSIDPYTNRFTQPDTIVPNPANPQSWNRYSYALNNPTLYSDPDGHNPIVVPIIALTTIFAIGYFSVLYVYDSGFRENADYIAQNLANTIDNVAEMAKRKPTREERLRDKIHTNDGVTADPPGGRIPVGPNKPISCFRSLRGAAACGALLLAGASLIYNNLIYGSDEPRAKTQTQTPPNPTSTGTLNPSCAPYLQCPTPSSTPMSTPTSTHTPVPTATQKKSSIRPKIPLSKWERILTIE